MKGLVNLNIVILTAFLITFSHNGLASSSCNSREHCAELCQAHEDALNDDEPESNYSCSISEMNGVEVDEDPDGEGQTTMTHTTYNCLCTPGVGGVTDGGGENPNGPGGVLVFPGGRPRPVPVPPNSDYHQCITDAYETYASALSNCQASNNFNSTSEITTVKPKNCEQQIADILAEDLRVCSNRFLKKVPGWKKKWNPERSGFLSF